MAVPTEEEKLAFAGIWSLVLDELSHRISIPTFQLWMETTKLAYLDANTAVVVTDRDFKRDIIEAKYFSTLCEILESIIGYSVTMYLLSSERGEPDLSTFTEPSDMTEVTEVIPGDSVHPEQVLVRQVKREPIQATPIHPNSDYTFDNYIVGESNKFAQAASYAVAKDPGNSYNPLFIYGESGLGKTHLLYSIMNEILRRFPDLSLLYVKGEEFTNELVDCLRQKTPSAFRQKYRSVDVLLIDDIQFIANKDGIQEEFFHTFNALYEDHKQIILAADRPPRDMTQLEARLRTRFEWGLLADIQPPGYELRVAILKNKAGSVGLNLPKEILAYLAGNLRSNIRQLEGAIKKIAAKAFISGLRAHAANGEGLRRGADGQQRSALGEGGKDHRPGRRKIRRDARGHPQPEALRRHCHGAPRLHLSHQTLHRSHLQNGRKAVRPGPLHCRLLLRCGRSRDQGAPGAGSRAS